MTHTTTGTVKYPCRGCVYFAVCGDASRREPCAGRETKRDRQRRQQAHTLYHLVQASIAYA